MQYVHATSGLVLRHDKMDRRDPPCERSAVVATSLFGAQHTEEKVGQAVQVLGAGILAVVAGINRDLGFTVLEVTWAIVSAVGLVRGLRSGNRSAV